MNPSPALKKPKSEPQESGSVAVVGSTANENGAELHCRSEQEEALVALIEHRTREVEHLRKRVTYYQSQLDNAEKRLEETQIKLANFHALDKFKASRKSMGDGVKQSKLDRRSNSPIEISEDPFQSQSQDELPSSDAKLSNSSASNIKAVKLERRSASPVQLLQESSQNQPPSRPQLVIPGLNSKISQPLKSSAKQSNPSIGQPSSIVKLQKDKPFKASVEQQSNQIQAKKKKRKFEQKEHKELIPLIRNCSSPCKISCQTACVFSSQHKRKLRSLILCPMNNQLFATSALDGIVNLWQLQARGSNANLLSTTQCSSSIQRRWPEDIAWHPDGDSLFCVYAADNGDSQISVLNLNKTKEKRVSFLDETPHVKGIINNIVFMPWEDTCFVTAGSDHAVVLWTEKDGENSWKPKALHRSMHSSAVMGVAGMLQKQVVISVGADKRIIAFDLLNGRADYKHQIDSKCMSVLTNPCDFNLFMVQTGTPEKQLRLFDIRLRQTEIHAFGWKQENSDSQSALINQAWSSDGLYLTSGSADPVIHIFDIRYNACSPSQSIVAHQKRVFKAVWHSDFPLLISISSDLNIGLHKVS